MSLGDGGTEYIYNDAGLRTVFKIPPQTFAADTAPADRVAFYGLPPKPSTPDELSNWLEMVHSLHWVVPPAYLAEAGAKADSQSSNWAGYEAYSSSSTAYTAVEGQYNEPDIDPTACGNDTEVTWAGLGGDPFNKPLAQDGTALKAPGLARHQAWYEILPDQSSMQALQLYAHAGYRFIAEVNQAVGGFAFYLYDSYSGRATSFQVNSNSYDGSHADFIVEKVSDQLSKFWYLNYPAAYVNGTSSSNAIGNYPNFRDYMQNVYTGDILADATGLSNNISFTVNWHFCN